jgi:hypothetical protein
MSAEHSPAKSHGESPSRKLTKEELTQVTDRLFYKQQERAKQNEEKRREKLESVGIPKKPLTSQGQENLVQRIYTAQLERKKKQQEHQEEQRASSTVNTKQISEAELTESVQRMYYAQKEHSNKEREKLAEKYGMKVDHKKLEKEQQQAMANRLSTWTKEEARKKLFEKYIAPMDPPVVKISADQVKAMADRLCKKKE